MNYGIRPALRVAIGLCLAIPGFSQIGGTGSIQGVILDPSGAVVPGASVTALHIATQVRTMRQTTDAGV